MSKTEKQKMLAGELYRPDSDLAIEQATAKAGITRHNAALTHPGSERHVVAWGRPGRGGQRNRPQRRPVTVARQRRAEQFGDVEHRHDHHRRAGWNRHARHPRSHRCLLYTIYDSAGLLRV